MSSSNAVEFDDAEPVPELVEETCLDASPLDPENIAKIAAALARPAAVLRGTARGLEIVLDGRAGIDAIAAALNERLAEAPGFFRGSNVRVRVEDGPLAPGCLARLDEIATRFELRVVELGAARRETDGIPAGAFPAGSSPAPVATETAAVPAHVDAIPEGIALGSSPYETLEVDRVVSPPANSNDDSSLDKLLLVEASAPIEAQLEATPEKTRVVIGPVRSGVILDHRGHLVVFGDVNPGAEVRAEGNIVVLGRLRGTAHAGIGRDVGFILALRLEPQQLRICRMVARASDSDAVASEPEIARIHSDSITVERYSGRLPRDLAASI